MEENNNDMKIDMHILRFVEFMHQFADNVIKFGIYISKAMQLLPIENIMQQLVGFIINIQVLLDIYVDRLGCSLTTVFTATDKTMRSVT